MAVYTYDPRLDTDLILHEMGLKLEVAEARLDEELQLKQQITSKLHDISCPYRELVTGSSCCDTNLWITKSRKVTECCIYAYQEITKAPHAGDCRYRSGMTCTCWKSPAMNNMVRFFQSIGRK